MPCLENATEINTKKGLSLLALLLLVPVPSLGIWAGMIALPNLLGRGIFFATKIWILGLPLFWHLFVDKKKLSISKPENGGFGIAGVLGVFISIFIFVFYFAFGSFLIEAERVKIMAENVGLDERWIYLAGAGYWIIINSALEEYVWRWFVVEKCKSVLPVYGAILLSAFCFTIHHIVAMQIYFNWVVVLIASFGIFVGGAIWSWCYNKYHSIWPGYLSHAIVDIAVFIIGYFLIFK